MRQGRGRAFDVLTALWALPFRISSTLARFAPSKPDGVLNRLQSDGTAIDGLIPRDFARLVGTGFQQRGFTVLEQKEGAGEDAAQLVLTRDGDRFLVECKYWRVPQVGGRAIRDLHAVMATRGAAGGFLVTSARFTKSARTLAAARNIELIDGQHLAALLRDGRRRVAEIIFSGVAANGPETAPHCPACKTSMIVRTAKRGSTAGSFFWACPQFPTCRQTMVMWSEGRRTA